MQKAHLKMIAKILVVIVLKVLQRVMHLCAVFEGVVAESDSKGVNNVAYFNQQPETKQASSSEELGCLCGIPKCTIIYYYKPAYDSCYYSH